MIGEVLSQRKCCWSRVAACPQPLLVGFGLLFIGTLPVMANVVYSLRFGLTACSTPDMKYSEMKMAENQENIYELNNVSQAIILFQHILENAGALNLTQLCKVMSMTKNKAFRMLATLEQHRLVSKDPHNNYTIGYASLETARKVMNKISALDSVQPCLKEVSDLLNEATYYAQIDRNRLLLISFVDNRRPVKVASLVGRSITLPNAPVRNAQLHNIGDLSDIMVDVGGFDPEVTAVIAPIDVQNVDSKRGAMVVIAPHFLMAFERINSTIIPIMRTVIQHHSLSRVNEKNQAFKRPVYNFLDEKHALYV